MRWRGSACFLALPAVLLGAPVSAVSDTSASPQGNGSTVEERRSGPTSANRDERPAVSHGDRKRRSADGALRRYGDDPYSGSFGNSRWGSPIPPYADVYGRPWLRSKR